MSSDSIIRKLENRLAAWATHLRRPYFLERRCKCVQWFPSGQHPIENRAVTDAVYLCPVLQTARFAINRDMYGPSGVAHLIAASCPSHIIRLVVTINVDALNLVVRTRTAADVLQKCRELLHAIPSLADLYTSSSVILISRLASIITTLQDAVQNSVFRTMRTPVCVASTKTAAMAYFTRLQRRCCNCSSSAAIAPAIP